MVSNHYIDHIFCLSCKLVKRKKMEPGMFYLNLNNMHLLHCLVIGAYNENHNIVDKEKA